MITASFEREPESPCLDAADGHARAGEREPDHRSRAARANRIARHFTRLARRLDLAPRVDKAPGNGNRFRRDLCALTGERLNEHIGTYMGDEFTAKDFRTWGGTLIAAIGLAERGVQETEAENKRCVVAVVRRVADRLGNTPRWPAPRT